jgi:hypothetical protein
MVTRVALLLVITGAGFSVMGWLDAAGPLAVLVGLAILGVSFCISVEEANHARRTPAELAGRGSTPLYSTHVRQVSRTPRRRSAA